MATAFEQFTVRARQALQAAQTEASRLGHHTIGAEHLLLGLLHDRASAASLSLLQLGLDLDELASATSAAAQKVAELSMDAGGLSPAARGAMTMAVQESSDLHHHYVGTEHLLLGLLREGTSESAHLLRTRGLSLEKARAAVVAILNQSPPMASAASVPVGRAGPTERLSAAGRAVLVAAEEEARAFNHNYIGTEHLLLGLVRETGSETGRLLATLGLDVHKLRDAIETVIGHGDRSIGSPLTLTPRANNVIVLADAEARRLVQSEVGPEHLLLGILREGHSIASGMFDRFGVDREAVRSAVVQSLSAVAVPSASARLGPRARSALLQAQLTARWYYHSQVDTEHLLIGLVRERGGEAARLLQEFGLELPRALELWPSLSQPQIAPPGTTGVSYTLGAQACLDRATLEASQRGHPLAGTGHLLLAVLSIVAGQAVVLLQAAGISPESLRERLEPLLSTGSE